MGKQTNKQPEEVLPLGVGRVPAWWMEITPHYTLDLEEQEARRAIEDQMSFYYAQMAAADDAGILDADGKPKLGPDGNPLTSSYSGNNGWTGRCTNGNGGAAGIVCPDGRTFAPGTAVINPEMFGISKDDPDYKNYLTGAKLPPGYLERMAEFAAQYRASTGSDSSGIPNNLQQTDYGRYGRQAETPAFQPAWAKLKLRSTNHGSALRYGIDLSPEKGGRRVVESDLSAIATTPLELEAQPEPEPVVEAPPPKQKKLVRKVRKVPKKKTGAPNKAVANKSTPTPTTRPTPPVEEKKDAYVPKTYDQYQHSDYYYNAGKQPGVDHHYDEDEYEEIVEEEIIEEYDDEYDEEIIEDDHHHHGPPKSTSNLSDLQAILAAKQAELMQLQAQM